MSGTGKLSSYGVKLQTPEGDEISRAAEKIAIVGFTVLESGYDKAQRKEIEDAFDALRSARELQYGRDQLAAIDEHNTIRAPLISSDVMLRLAQNERLLRLSEVTFGDAFALNQQNGIINPSKERYNQAAWHRDLPYQHFVVSRPIAINALYCIDDFTKENGCTKVIPGSHKHEAFPADSVVRELALDVEAPAGTFLVLDSMIFHTGGQNVSARPRRAINHLFTLPFVKQQISFKSAFDGRDIPSATRRLLALDDEQVTSVEAYYERRRAKAQK